MRGHKSIIVLYCLLTFLLLTGTIFGENPIITQRYCADPNGFVFNGRLYAICSSDEENVDSYNLINYTLISTDDMANWTDHGLVFKVKSVTTWANQAYAPTAIYRKGKVWLYFPNGAESIGVAVADRPEGPYKDALGHALITKSMTNCNVGWLFDPCVFVDSTAAGEQVYLTFGGGDPNGTNLRIIKINDDMISVSGTAQTITAPNSFEASFLHKYNNKYYFSYATTGASKMDYLMSDNPMTGYTYAGTILENPILNGQNIDLNNNNHGHPVLYKGQWYEFYHDRRISNLVYKRNVCIDVLTYNEKGNINKVVVTSEGPAQIKSLNPYDTVQAETIGKQNGIEVDFCDEGGTMVTSISDGDWIKYTGVDFGVNAEKFEARVAAATGGSIELHLNSETGTKIGTCTVASTGGLTTWKTVSCDVSGASGVKNLYLVFKGSGEPFRFNWFRFTSLSSVKNGITAGNETRQKTKKQVIISKEKSFQHIGNFVDLSGRTASISKDRKISHGCGVFIQQK